MGGFARAIFGKPKVPSMPLPQLPVAPPDMRAARAEAEKKRRAAALAKGAASTLLTGGQGLLEDAPVLRHQLMGQ
jgi:hypothetical protein